MTTARSGFSRSAASAMVRSPRSIFGRRTSTSAKPIESSSPASTTMGTPASRSFGPPTPNALTPGASRSSARSSSAPWASDELSAAEIRIFMDPLADDSDLARPDELDELLDLGKLAVLGRDLEQALLLQHVRPVPEL